MLIVDDEYEIREGLRKQFPWHEFGIQSIMVASDGDEALQWTTEHHPDLILTDIKMSRMSGLEYLAAMQEETSYPWKAILISGYDDFNLVKRAMQLGAMDYILKPIRMEELERIVRKAVDVIEYERLSMLQHERNRSQAHFAEPKLREELLREMIENEHDSYTVTRITHRLHALQLDWMNQLSLRLMIIEVDNLKALTHRYGQHDEKELVLFGIGNVINHTLVESTHLPFVLFRDSDGRCVVVMGCNHSDDPEIGETIAQICLDRIQQFVKVNASIGATLVSKEIHSLHQQYLDCSEYLEQKIVYGGNQIFTGFVEEGIPELGLLSIRDSNAVVDLVRYGTYNEIIEAMLDFEGMVKCWELQSLRDIQQQLFKWLMGVYRAAAAAGWQNRSWEQDPIDLWDQLEQYDTVQSSQAHIESCLLQIAEDFRKMTTSSSQLVQETDRMIRERFAENITLQSIADAVHVTPVWLSKLYKKERGRTFIEALTDARISSAKELLGDVKYKIYQVSHAVGYKDAVHFSRLFKKQVGVTPKEYRRLRGILDD